MKYLIYMLQLCIGLLIGVYLPGCVDIPVKVEEPVVFEYKQNIVSGMEKSLEDGNTIYNLAFENGKSITVSYGVYNSLEVDDTVCWEREKNWFWYLIKCDEVES